jgi:hypothetical protein
MGGKWLEENVLGTFVYVIKVYGIMFVPSFVKIRQNLKIEMDTRPRTWDEGLLSLAVKWPEHKHCGLKF